VPSTTTVLLAAAYLLVGRWLTRSRARWRDAAFAVLNVAAVYRFFFWGKDYRFALLFNLLFGAYVALITVQYLALRLWSGRPDRSSWLAFFTPIAFLIFIRYAPLGRLSVVFGQRVHEVLQRHPEFTLSWVFERPCASSSARSSTASSVPC